MTNDPAHPLEYDPAWRWRLGLALVLDRPPGEGGREAAIALEDQLLRDCLLPYLRFRVDGLSPPGMAESDFRATWKALDIWSVRDREYYQLPHRLEAGVLAGRPEGRLVPGSDRVDGLVQRLYEGLFFAVRPHLDDREWLLRAVFGQPWPHTQAAVCGLRSKVIAYGLGDAELQDFRDGRPSARAFRLLGRLDLTIRYLGGLRLLGLFQSDDPANCFRRIFQEADRMRAEPDGRDDYDLPVAMTPAWRERLAGLARQIPPPIRPPTAKKTGADRPGTRPTPPQRGGKGHGTVEIPNTALDGDFDIIQYKI
jgi:hypothetical protein